MGRREPSVSEIALEIEQRLASEYHRGMGRESDHHLREIARLQKLVNIEQQPVNIENNWVNSQVQQVGVPGDKLRPLGVVPAASIAEDHRVQQQKLMQLFQTGSLALIACEIVPQMSQTRMSQTVCDICL